ncbi:MAG: efflux RND transporter permease subunit [Dongiaceae bacterium]
MDTDNDPVNDNEMAIKVVLDKARPARGHGRHSTATVDLHADLAVTQFLRPHAGGGQQGAQLHRAEGLRPGSLDPAHGGRGADRFAEIPGLTDLLVEQQQNAQLRVQVDYAEDCNCSASRRPRSPRLLEGFLGNWSSRRSSTRPPLRRRAALGGADRTPEALALLRLDTPAGRCSLLLRHRLDDQRAEPDHPRDRRSPDRGDGHTDGSDVTLRRSGACSRSSTRTTTGRLPLQPGRLPPRRGEPQRGGDPDTDRHPADLHQPGRISASARQCGLIIAGRHPLALVGGVAAIWIAGQDLNLATMTGFIAVIGITVRNSLLKVSHFINLHLHEGMPQGRDLVLRGSAERLMPVLMTALSAGLGLAPLLLASDRAGAEILHPVAVTIFGGLISSTLLDTFTTPLLFERYGQRAVAGMITGDASLAYETF